MAKYGERETRVWYSMQGNWIQKDVFTCLRTPDAWRYFKEDEREEGDH